MCETEGVFERLHKNKNQDVNNMENRNEKKKTGGKSRAEKKVLKISV